MATSLYTLLLQALREHESASILASPEEADFFRAQIQHAPAPREPIQLPPLPVEKKIPVQKEPPVQPISLPKPIANEAQVAPKTSFSLPKHSADFSSVRHVLSIVAPELAILNEIPSDYLAIKVSQRWKTKNQTAPISILSFQEPDEQRALLESIAIALDAYFGPAKIVYAERIEKEKQWETFLAVPELKMVIVCDYALWQLHHLMTFYKENPAQGTRVLGNVPLFLLPDLSLYLKDPLLKRSLWKALCQKFS